jgi:hypothetical protein
MKCMCHKRKIHGCETGDPFATCHPMSMVKIMELVKDCIHIGHLFRMLVELLFVMTCLEGYKE